jgi:hypothetical protein
MALLLAGASAVLGAPLWLKKRTRERIALNQWQALETVKSIARAQAEFRAHDIDGNGVLDDWTGDVAGLKRFGLIDRATAMADARPLVPDVPVPVPKRGYLFRVIEGEGAPGRFAVVAFPAEPGDSGRRVYIANPGEFVYFDDRERQDVLRWPSDDELRFWGKTRVPTKSAAPRPRSAPRSGS